MPPPIEAAAAFGIAYRPMTDDDLPFVAALYATTRAEEFAEAGLPPEMAAALSDHQHRAQHDYYRSAYKDAEWLIVEQDGEAIGRLYLAPVDGTIRLIDISLMPEARDGGIGTAILSDLLADAERRGLAVTLHVDPGSRAQRLYERHGFAPVAELPGHLKMEWPAPAGSQ